MIINAKIRTFLYPVFSIYEITFYLCTMIQRVQTIYLFLVAAACVLYIFLPIGNVTLNDVAGVWYIKQSMPNLITDILLAIIAVVAIFLYNNRQMQMKVVLVNILLSLALIGLFFYELMQHYGISHYSFRFGAVLPIFILLFNVLAYGSIKSDEKLVRSMDRLR